MVSNLFVEIAIYDFDLFQSALNSLYLSSFSSCRPTSKKNQFFTNLRVHTQFFLSACCGLNFDATDLPNSWLEPLYPKGSSGSLMIDLVSTVCPPDLPKVR